MTHAKLKVETLPLIRLRPHPQNPRTHPERGSERWNALKKSLEDVYFDPLIWNRKNGMLVSGHLRAKVLDEMGCKKADTVVVNFTEKQHVRIMLRANRNDGDWENDQLTSLLKEMQDDERLLAGFDLDGLKELDIQLNGEKEMEDAEPKIDHAKELQKKWQTQLGQIWKVGEHKLMCGDSAKSEDIDAAMGGLKANAILTDPIYGQSQKGVPNDSPEEMQRIVPASCALLPVTDAIAVLFQSPRTFPTALDAMRSNGWIFERALWLYKQAQCVKPWRGWLLTSEAILVFSKGEATWNECNPYAHDCYMLPEVSGELTENSGWHGSVKPLKVVTDIAQRISIKGQSIFDPFLGSGTTMVACQNLERKCIGVEIAPEYVGVALQRMEDAFGITGELVK